MTTTTAIPTITIDVPTTFFDDHRSRELNREVVVVKELQRTTRVQLTPEQYDELLSDARHYAEPDPSWTIRHEAYLLGISRSAQAAMKRLTAVADEVEALRSAAAEQDTEEVQEEEGMQAPEVRKLDTKKWIVEGHEDRRFTSKRAAQEFAATLDQAPAQEEAPELDPPAQTDDRRYDVLMVASGTPVLGNAPMDAVTWFLAQRVVQSKVSKPLRAFVVQDRTLKPDPEHEADYLVEAVDAEIFATEHLTKETVAAVQKELAHQSQDGASKGKKVLKTLADTRPKKAAKQARTPEVGERFADEQLVTGSGGKVTYGMVRRIREETEQFFIPGGPRGKVAAYKRLAKELGLGMETVAKISRRNIFADVE